MALASSATINTAYADPSFPLAESSLALRFGSVQTTGSASNVQVPVESVQAVASIVAQGIAPSPSQPTYISVGTEQMSKLLVNTSVSTEWASQPRAMDSVRTSLAAAVSKALDDDALGTLASDVTAGQTIVAAGASPTAAELSAALAKVPSRSLRHDAVILANPAVIAGVAELIRREADGSMSLMGLPLYFTDSLGSSTGDRAMLVGSLSDELHVVLAEPGYEFTERQQAADDTVLCSGRLRYYAANTASSVASISAIELP